MSLTAKDEDLLRSCVRSAAACEIVEVPSSLLLKLDADRATVPANDGLFGAGFLMGILASLVFVGLVNLIFSLLPL